MKKKLEYYLNLNYPIEVIKIPEDEGGGYSASIPALGKLAVVSDGATAEEAISNVLKLKDEYIKELFRKGIPIPEPAQIEDLGNVSGRFLVRIPKELHKALIKKAKENDISLNQYINYLLTKALYIDTFEQKVDEFFEVFYKYAHQVTETNYDLNFEFKSYSSLFSEIKSVKDKRESYLKAG
ncbi:MAG: type II toxin-antitoxin system HicB family antitoxin [Ignavibacteria bacterium]|nr:type II toxin-antitoxin system HicB family antitoxin [Ignavibacteria bacterium]MDH7528674.1 toxin-antitoxin system HicB family antitoxin [Ignavibacteria bacterium]NPV11145.1 toxin-antitoxin system HicB family antitoxin [Ignavibacteria bacterium]